ncbi:RNA 2',3'-cyclic phosphodiesterase [Candidatus Daviesbacteria bacterium]|nr:RNA 2',3'-cyclic phosphodiesterase [Candidatus Daviesbacteria bacterium]
MPDISLSDNDKLHLTLAFVGEQPEELIEPLTEVVAKAAEGIPSFEVIPSYIDGFPHLHQAKVLWVGVKGDVDKLMILRHKIKDGLIALRQDVDERRFIPHIALAKAKGIRINKKEEEELQSLMSRKYSPITISSIKLFQSIPNHGFHKHNTLAEIKLLP